MPFSGANGLLVTLLSVFPSGTERYCLALLCIKSREFFREQIQGLTPRIAVIKVAEKVGFYFGTDPIAAQNRLIYQLVSDSVPWQRAPKCIEKH
jgi:hypothetical protein